MASINTIITVTITKGTQTVATQSFSVACIFGPSAIFSGIRYYSSVAAMLADGFISSDPEVIYAEALSGQSPTVSKWAVSNYTASVAQQDTFQVNTLTTSHAYHFTLNGVPVSYTSTGGDTQQSILAALLAAAIAAFSPAVVSGSVSGTGPSALLTMTSTAPGAGISYTAIDSDLTHVATVPNHSIVSDIAATQNIDDTWYGVLVTTQNSWDIEQIAAYVESQLKLYGASSTDSNIITSSSTDLASILRSKSYNRTFLLYAGVANDGREAAWMGVLFPAIPGSANWNFKTLAGIAVDNLNPTQIGFAQGKNCNVYIPIGGVNIATVGTASSGQFIDVTVFLDWLKSTMQSNVFSVLVNSAKVPYTNKGIVAIENPIAQTLQQGQDNGGIAPGWKVTGPDVANVSSADKAARVLNGVAFSATLAGAINKISIQGFVSV